MFFTHKILKTKHPTSLMKNWLDEAEKRANAIDKGITQLIPEDIVMLKAKSLLNPKTEQRALIIKKIQRSLDRVEMEGGITHKQATKRFKKRLID
jgi:hypothetical protein